MKIGHISDLHILDLQGITPLRFINKRVTGGANLLFKRSHTHRTEVVEAALEHLQTQAIDHLVITGDFTNLALGTEFRRAKEIITRYFPPEKISVVPGNHDRYTAGAALTYRFEKYFADLLDDDIPTQGLKGWPRVKLLDGVAVIGLSSAIALPWLASGGRIGRRQMRALAELLQDERVKSRFRVVILHHPVTNRPHKRVEPGRGLLDRRALLNLLRFHRVELLLHGHNHYYDVRWMPHRRDSSGLIICEAGSGSVAHADDERRGGKLNIYHIEAKQLTAIETFLYEENKGFKAWKNWTMLKGKPVLA